MFPLFVYPNYFAEPMVLSALAVAASIIALSLMFGEFFSNAALKAFGKAEAKELGVSAVIIALAILLITPGSAFDLAANGFAPPPPAGQPPEVCQEWLDSHGGAMVFEPVTGSYSVPGGNMAFGTAGHFLGCRFNWNDLFSFFSNPINNSLLDGVLLPHLIGNYAEFMVIEAITGFLSSFNVAFSLPVPLFPGFDFNPEISGLLPFIFVTPINEAHTLIVDIAGTLVAATASQKMLLDFIEANTMSLILPIGIIMRVFPFTRKTGSTIVAFAFAAYFIFPMSVLINARLYEAIQNPPCDNLKPVGAVCQVNSECCSGNCGMDGKCQAKITNYGDYLSSFTICGDSLGEANWRRLEPLLDAEEQKEREFLAQLEQERQRTGKLTQTQEQQRQRLIELELRKAIVAQQEARGQGNYFLPPPGEILEWVWARFEHAVLETAKTLVLVALFIVMEIIIVLTLFKDFSLLIGGEPKLLGISKLV
ncbi:MAG: hypothetical protein QW568_04635 [Candidatus Anstonellaceae archaeon]